MGFDEHFRRGEEEEPLTTVFITKFDVREEMDRAVKNLEMLIGIPKESDLSRKPEEKKDEYDRALAQIDSAQQGYLKILEQAKKAGAIDIEAYERARMDISSSFSSFERVRSKVREAYRKVVKFG